MKLLIPVIATVLALTGCKSGLSETDVSRKNAVEITFQTKHLEDSDLLITTRKVYIDNLLVKEFISTDTLPSLGKVKVEDETSKVPNKLVDVPKEYELYVTIK